MSDPMAIVFIIGKAAIWLVIPLLFGIYEMRKHRRDMRSEARGESTSSSIPGWLRQKPRHAAQPTPQTAPAADPEPLPVAARDERGAGSQERRRAA
jgi:hypothetical protein